MTSLGHDEATDTSADSPDGATAAAAVRRRTMLGTSALAGVGLIAVTATACGSNGGGTASTTPGSGGAGASSAARTAGGAAAAPGGASGTQAQAGGTTLGSASAVPVGGGVIYADHQVVVTQPQAGVYKGFSSTCTHAGCTVSKVSGGRISCPCHGSQFSATDGSVEHGPAQSPLPAKQISVQGGLIVLDG